MNLISNLFRSYGSKSSPAKFWAWFTANSKLMFQIQTGHEAVLKELARELDSIHEHLTYEIGGAENGVRELVISADGFKSAIPAVEDLVKKAPKLSDWTVTAFRQPLGELLTVEYGAARLAPDAVWFKAGRNGSMIDVNLFLDGYNAAHKSDYLACVFLTLDHLLGEYKVMTRVGAIEVGPLSANPAAAGLRPIAELKGEF